MVNISTEGDERKQVQLQESIDEGQLSLDIFETEESIFLIAPVAGVNRDSVQISLTEDLVTISGERPFPTSLPNNSKYFVEECFWGNFSRSVLLPSAVNSADISARIEHEIIIIEVPKARKTSSKNIPLSSL
jgi:HSP20 family protein